MTRRASYTYCRDVFIYVAAFLLGAVVGVIIGMYNGTSSHAVLSSYRNSSQSDIHMELLPAVNTQVLDLASIMDEIHNFSARIGNIGFSVAVYGAADGQRSRDIAHDYPSSSVISFSLFSRSMLHSNEARLAYAGLANIALVNPVFSSSTLNDEPAKFTSVSAMLDALVDTPEFFEYQLWDDFTAWGSHLSKRKERSLSVKPKTYKKTLGNVMSLGRVTFFILHSIDADEMFLRSCANAVGITDISVTVLDDTIADGVNIKVIRVELLSMVRKVRELVHPRCAFEYIFKDDALFEVGRHVCNPENQRRNSAKIIPWVSHGTSVATLMGLGLSRVTHLGLLSLFLQESAQPMYSSESRFDKILCCRHSRLVGIHGALPNARPRCTYTYDADGTILDWVPKNHPYNLDIDWKNYPVSHHTKLLASERLQMIAHDLLACYSSYHWFQYNKLHGGLHLNDYCADFPELESAQKCFYKNLMHSLLND